MRALLPLLALPLLVSCRSVRVETDWDPAFDFAGMETWAWLAPIRTHTPAVHTDNRLVRERVRRAVEAELSGKGLRRVDDAAGADLLVVAHAVVRRRVDVDWVTRTYGYRYHRWGPGYAVTEPVTWEYTEGTLVVDVVRGPGRELVWTGSATGVVDPDATPEEREQRIREAVAELLAGFPPGGGPGPA